MSGAPDPKSRILAQRERKYRRKIASPKQWAAIRAAKLDGQPCRICATYGPFRFTGDAARQLHHLVARSQGGDDTADNLVGVCWEHHALITQRYAPALSLLSRALTDAEYAYVVGKLGEGGMARLFGTDAA